MTYTFGQHIEVSRTFYAHHGIYIGNNEVIHYSSPPESNSDGVGLEQVLGADSEVNTIHAAPVKNFKMGSSVDAITYNRDHVYPPLKVVARAMSRIGESGYNLWGNNCEHFTRWCKIADSESIQINFWKSTLKGGASGALLGRWVGPTGAIVGGVGGAVIGAVRAWLSKKINLLPVYKEFSEYASELIFSTKRLHPLGKSFKHSSEFDDKKKKFIIPAGKEDQVVIFHYSGTWLIGEECDWFITERAIVYPAKDVYINFHDVQKIYSSSGSLIIEEITGKEFVLPSKFVDSSSLAKFLNSSVAMTPFYSKDFKISFKAILKEMLKMLVGGIALTFITAFFGLAPFAVLITIIIVILSPFAFMDKNEKYNEDNN